MRFKITKKATFTLILVVFFVFLDKLFKTLSIKGYLDEPEYILGDVFSLHFTKNPNIAFSLPVSGPFLTIFISIVIFFLIWWWSKLFVKNSKLQTSDPTIYPLTILLFGAILNFTDRLKFGYVIDYLDLKYFTVFNVADIMITGSVFYLILITINKK
ncbi:hypothetical protein GF382_00025 [Candidatus Falkowbacteria bacterium]|nr:hypothetical protein [Candidatus Falkowbacteria bacterium]